MGGDGAKEEALEEFGDGVSVREWSVRWWKINGEDEGREKRIAYLSAKSWFSLRAWIIFLLSLSLKAAR